ncbi:MAG TPA: peptide ABC transporter substrate-binding protein [Candidatus Limnocylindria bacterium]|nr:peptide ABC transporter substrate-binding protein [Candidatus Limnocylindria bacterium]
MRKRNQLWSLLTLLTVLAMIIGACTSQPGQQAQSTQDADPNGTITTNTGAEPDDIDPQKESFTNEIGVSQLVFEALLSLDPKTLKPIPGAAKELPKVSADGLKYTYTLRDGLKYSDGQPLTMKNFEYAWKRVCDPTVAGEYQAFAFIVSGCEAYSGLDPKKASKSDLDAARAKVGVKAIDDKTLEFTLTEPAAYFIPLTSIWISDPVREDLVTKGGDKWTEPATYIGNGPFKLAEWKHNEKLVFERNDNFREKVGLKRWTKVMINEGAVAFAAYRNNELDTVGFSAEDLRTIDADPELKANRINVGGACNIYFGTNMTKPPFSDINVRQAFSKAVDREDYVKNVAGGLAKAANGGFIPPGFPGYDDKDDAQKYDPAAAKALLAKASPEAQAALKSLKISYSSSARNKTRAEWQQQQYKTNLGLDVGLDPVDSSALSKLLKKRDTTPSLYRLGWCSDYPDQQDWLTAVFKGNSSVGSTGYASKEFDDLVSKADKETDPKKRDDLYNQASKILSKDAPATWVYYSISDYLRKPWLKNVEDSSQDPEGATTYTAYKIYVTKH